MDSNTCWRSSGSSFYVDFVWFPKVKLSVRGCLTTRGRCITLYLHTCAHMDTELWSVLRQSFTCWSKPLWLCLRIPHTNKYIIWGNKVIKHKLPTTETTRGKKNKWRRASKDYRRRRPQLRANRLEQVGQPGVEVDGTETGRTGTWGRQ